MFSRRKKTPDPAAPPSPNLYSDLRRQALAAVESRLVAPTESQPRVGGAVVDIPSDGGFVTVMTLSDGTTSMYTSTGGGRIGAGGHAPVAEAGLRLLVAVDSNLAQFSAGDDGSLPKPGRVRFHVLGFGGPVHADVPDDCFWGRAEHVLMPVIAATRQLIAAISSVSRAP